MPEVVGELEPGLSSFYSPTESWTRCFPLTLQCHENWVEPGDAVMAGSVHWRFGSRRLRGSGSSHRSECVIPKAPVGPTLTCSVCLPACLWFFETVHLWTRLASLSQRPTFSTSPGLGLLAFFFFLIVFIFGFLSSLLISLLVLVGVEFLKHTFNLPVRLWRHPSQLS